MENCQVRDKRIDKILHYTLKTEVQKVLLLSRQVLECTIRHIGMAKKQPSVNVPSTTFKVSVGLMVNEAISYPLYIDGMKLHHVHMVKS
jgi:hypothetical protein